MGGQEDGCGKGSVEEERTGGTAVPPVTPLSVLAALSSLWVLAAAAATAAVVAAAVSSSLSLGAGLGVVDGLFPPEEAEPEVDEAEPRRALVQSKTLLYT